MGSNNYFRNHFLLPILKNKDQVRAEKLRRLINPFILRRTKEEVAKDLPPLSQQVLFCDMTEEQKSVYEKEKSGLRNKLFENLDRMTGEKSRFVALQALMRLRLLANHPTLVDEHFNGESGKFERIRKSLNNLRIEKHKVLIFSSFVKHLRLIEKYCQKHHWKYSMLTGETLNREHVIDEFQYDDENLIFLISLKAGGVGLNLTSADYVFILDPWWNPAAEMQAINRAHRIGQDKKVMVYRFITAESIEEKIALLQNEKTELADAFVQSNNPLKNISDEELKALFE